MADDATPKIPKPPSCEDDKLLVLETLFNAMQTTHGTTYHFCRFKRLVRDSFIEFELDLQQNRANQDPQKWDELMRRVLKGDKKLYRYEGYWPIETYFNAHVKYRNSFKTTPYHINMAAHEDTNGQVTSTRAATKENKPVNSTFREWQINHPSFSASAPAGTSMNLIKKASTSALAGTSKGTNTTPTKNPSASALSAPATGKLLRCIVGKTPQRMRTVPPLPRSPLSPTPVQRQTQATAILNAENNGMSASMAAGSTRQSASALNKGSAQQFASPFRMGSSQASPGTHSSAATSVSANQFASAFNMGSSRTSSGTHSTTATSVSSNVGSNSSQALLAPAPSPALKPAQAIQPPQTTQPSQPNSVIEPFQHASNTKPTYPYPCFKCGNTPPLPATLTRSLHSFFPSPAESHLLTTLAASGLLHDAHLEMYLLWPPADRSAFITSIPEEDITSLERMLLGKRFDKYREWQGRRGDGNLNLKRKLKEEEDDDGVQSPRKAVVLDIPQPSAERERQLIDPSKPPLLLRLAMKLQDDAEFEEVNMILNNMSYVYLSCFNPKNGPDQERLETVIKTIHQMCPALRRYENDWAIKFYMKRRFQLGGGMSQPTLLGQGQEKIVNANAGSGSNSLSSRWYNRAAAGASRAASAPQQKPTLSPLTPASAQASAPTPTPTPLFPLPRTTCPVHAPIDLTTVSPKMQTFLAKRGMDELAPTLATVGVRTDALFDQFCGLSEAEQKVVLGDQRHVKVTRFQAVMLKVAFRAVGGVKREFN